MIITSGTVCGTYEENTSEFPFTLFLLEELDALKSLQSLRKQERQNRELADHIQAQQLHTKKIQQERIEYERLRTKYEKKL